MNFRGEVHLGARLVRDQKAVGSNPTAPTVAGTGAFGSTGALGASGSGFKSLVPDLGSMYDGFRMAVQARRKGFNFLKG